jgi:predicted PurR-regulated permease PerM
MPIKIIEKYFFFSLLFATFVFTFFIFQPFWIVLVLGASFSVVLYPVYQWLVRHRVPSWVSSLLTICLFTLLLGGPLLGAGSIVFNQSQNTYNMVRSNTDIQFFLSSMEENINSVLPEVAAVDVSQKTGELLTYLTSNVASIFRNTVSATFSFFLMLFIIFYFLKDGVRWKKALVDLSPLEDKDDEKILSMLSLSVNAVIKGYLLIAVVQGVLMGIGLWIFGIPSFALWAVVAAAASLLPIVGTALVSIPAIIFLVVINDVAGAIGLAIWATMVVGMVDNFLSPLIIGKKINIPPLLILFSVLGGISLLGPVGILVGPLSVSLLYTLIAIYQNEFRENA